MTARCNCHLPETQKPAKSLQNLAGIRLAISTNQEVARSSRAGRTTFQIDGLPVRGVSGSVEACAVASTGRGGGTGGGVISSQAVTTNIASSIRAGRCTMACIIADAVRLRIM
jgi:hypothetical protein